MHNCLDIWTKFINITVQQCLSGWFPGPFYQIPLKICNQKSFWTTVSQRSSACFYKHCFCSWYSGTYISTTASLYPSIISPFTCNNKFFCYFICSLVHNSILLLFFSKIFWKFPLIFHLFHNIMSCLDSKLRSIQIVRNHNHFYIIIYIIYDCLNQDGITFRLI